jgi:preprotein translocase subunit YajC
MQTLIFLLLIVMVWVVLIVPRQREMRRHRALMSQLEVGDEVMMGSGIYGTIRHLEGDHALLEVAPGTELRVARRAIAARVDPARDHTIDADTTDTADSIDMTDSIDTTDSIHDDGPGRPGAAEA